MRVTQLSYNAGILTENMTGRADDAKYTAGLAECENAFCTPQGPIKRRAGFAYVGAAKTVSGNVRLVPFSYSATDTVVIELGDKYARFHTMGKTLLADSGEPYEIATPWRSEDIFHLHYAQNAQVLTFVHPAYRPMELTRRSVLDWRLEPVSLNTKLAIPTGVRADRITAANNDDNAEKYTQKYVVTALNKDRTEESQKSAEAAVVANLFSTGTTVKILWDAVPNARFYRIYKLQGGVWGYIGETETTSIIDDNIAPEVGTTPPYADDVFEVSRGITRVNVVDGGSGYSRNNGGVAAPKVGEWVWTISEERAGDHPKPDYSLFGASVIDKSGRGSGAKVKLECSLRKYVKYVTKPGAGKPVDRPKVPYWCTEMTVTKVVVTDPGENYLKPEFHIKTNSGGWGRIKEHTVTMPFSAYGATIEVTDSTGYGADLVPVVSAEGKIAEVIIRSGGTNYTAPKLTVKAERGSGAVLSAELATAGDFPAAVGYYEQRRVFAGSKNRPQRIWMTVTGTQNNMTYHLPLNDDDRISFEIASQDLNQIQHIVGLQQLLILTAVAEWRVSPLNSDAITPTSISVRPQTYVGASHVQPVMASNTAIYAASRGGHIREVSYNYNAGGYVTGDMSLRTEGLFDEQEIVDLAYSKVPFPVVWATSSSGALLGMTYVPEQQLNAWFKYTTKGFIRSVAVVQEGLYDAVYCVISRDIGGRKVNYIERLKFKDHGTRKGLYLDCAGEYDGEPTSQVTGLTWLAGEKVTVVIDGAVYEDVTVPENGVLQLPEEGQKVYVGLPYEMRVRTMPIVAGTPDGSLAKGHTKNLSRAWLRVDGSGAPEIGYAFDNMTQTKTRTKEAYGAPPELIDGIVEAHPHGNWVPDSSICIRLAKPLPFTLISHAADIVTGD